MKFKTVQRIVEFSTILLLLIGLFWIIFGSVIWNKNKDISDSSEYNIFKICLYIAIGFGCLLILWALIGLVAACKKFNCLLGTYNIGIFFILLFSASILVISIIVAANLPDYKDDKNCTQKSILKDLKQLNTASFDTLCKTDCQCQFKGFVQQAIIQGITNYNQNSGAVRVQDCSVFGTKIDFDNFQDNSKLFRSMEETFDCSGFCSINSYYVFSNVNNGIPQKDCKIQVIDYIDTHLNKILIASAIITFVLLVSFIFSICLCCKKPRGENFYERNGVGYHSGKQ